MFVSDNDVFTFSGFLLTLNKLCHVFNPLRSYMFSVFDFVLRHFLLSEVWAGGGLASIFLDKSIMRNSPKPCGLEACGLAD